MSRQIVNTEKAPAPIGPYSQAVKAGNLLFISGQVALNAESGHMVNEDIQQEAGQVMKNLEAILHAAGMDFTNIIKTTIFLSDMNLFAAVNDVYAGYFQGDYPARETLAVKGLPKNANVEISVIAAA